MVIYGVGILALCMLIGMVIGEVLGLVLGVKANIGGVGISMLLLILMSNINSFKFEIGSIAEKGINFWSAIYIPIVVAMAAKQNVVAAISGGWLAICAGSLAVLFSFICLPILDSFNKGNNDV